MKLFWSFARQAFHTTAIYRFDFWLRVVSNFVWMFSAYWLWTILYTQKPGAFNISLEQMVTYALLSSVMGMVMRPGSSVSYIIARKVKTGEIIMDMLKPLDFHMHMLARNVGEALFFTLTLGTPSFLIAYFLLGMRLPPQPITGLLFLLSLALGYGIMFSLSYLIGLLSVFTINIENISWAYNSIVRFFSGSDFPLWLFPLFLVQVSNLLPFKCTYAIPLSIYIGKLTPSEMANALALQIIWLLTLVVVGKLVWRLAHKRLTVQGG
jgi:ABC-2 type transport system permease protein